MQQSTNIKATNKDKNRAKKKKKINNTFLLCFQPLTMDGPVNPDSENGDGNLGFKYIAVKDEEGGGVFPSILSSSSSPSLDNKDAAATRKKKFGNRSLSRTLKAILFEVSLIKKLRKKKHREKMNRSYPKASAKTLKKSNPPLEISLSNNPEANTSVRRSISNSSTPVGPSSIIASTSSCSLCGSSLANRNNSHNSSSPSSSLQDNVNNVQEQGKGFYGVNFGLCFVVLSLVVLVFWGKACAIFCTSTWLFFVPRQSIRKESRNMLEFDSEQCKKKIIMEGLLDRNRIQIL